ncbi:MAG: 1,6-anhydro-N-acetylmuramyl-L-alanine amidase [uncultured Paraburkholderia sp.]|nr:MAG: 1,6-anhydro-N-acetylmuramyl-L-alanine amidase [uncultured Paraburkholderia sp.]CAH2940094.1 MAG: 1,6-anhydro-N-acetylmuramyl-L-alanine amidase [uncultured Paraburkholderia sp.]
MSDAFTVDADGWVAAARKLPSPNFEARPEGAVPTLTVVHNISLPPSCSSTRSTATRILLLRLASA